MIEQEFRDTWRVTLGPGDYADVPPMEIELKDPDQKLPKPYTKRYTKGQLAWWRKRINSLLKANIIKKTTNGNNIIFCSLRFCLHLLLAPVSAQ